MWPSCPFLVSSNSEYALSTYCVRSWSDSRAGRAIFFKVRSRRERGREPGDDTSSQGRALRGLPASLGHRWTGADLSLSELAPSEMHWELGSPGLGGGPGSASNSLCDLGHVPSLGREARGSLNLYCLQLGNVGWRHECVTHTVLYPDFLFFNTSLLIPAGSVSQRCQECASLCSVTFLNVAPLRCSAVSGQRDSKDDPWLNSLQLLDTSSFAPLISQTPPTPCQPSLRTRNKYKK